MTHHNINSDIDNSSLIFKITPCWLHNFIKVTRLDRFTGSCLLLMPLYWAMFLFGSIDMFFILQLVLVTISGVAMRSAGCIINDLFDINFDKQVERTSIRPIASGQVSIFMAVLYLVLTLAFGSLALNFMPISAIKVALYSVPLIIIYPLMKRWSYYPQVILGFVFS